MGDAWWGVLKYQIRTKCSSSEDLLSGSIAVSCDPKMRDKVRSEINRNFFSGLNTSLVPMYISEIAPLNLRGGLGTVNQLAVTVGLLLSQVLGIEQILGTNEGWPLLLGLAVCPALLQLVLLPVCPESPRYLLITKQWEEEARKALRRLRASNQVEEDIEEMRAEERAQQAEASISMMELICSPTLRSPLIIGVVMQLSQQLSGINAVRILICL